jgi:hypothetical protein
MRRLVLLLALAACQAGQVDVGEPAEDDLAPPPPPVDDDPGDEPADDPGDEPADDPDAGPDAASPDPIDAAVDAASVTPDPPDAAFDPACIPAAQAPAGKHYEGLACMSCHGPGGGAPRFTLAGTVFASPATDVPEPGATVVIVDANGVETRLVSARDGGFYTRRTLAYPLQVKVSRCPTTGVMTMAVPAPGNCNACHTGVGAPGRVHLP